MNHPYKCKKCDKELNHNTQKITQTSERGLEGFYHNECYDQAKAEKLEKIGIELS